MYKPLQVTTPLSVIVHGGKGSGYGPKPCIADQHFAPHLLATLTCGHISLFVNDYSIMIIATRNTDEV
jgi:hypothetical protein